MEGHIFSINDTFCCGWFAELVSFDISMPIMFIFFGLSMLANAKERYDKGEKGEAMGFGGIAVLLYAVTAYNLISRVL